MARDDSTRDRNSSDRSRGERSGTTAADSWLRRRPLSVDITLAAALAVIALPTTLRLIWISDSQVGGRLAITGVVLLAHVSVALRRIRMRSAFALVSLAALILVLAPAVGGAAAAQVGSEFAPILLPSSVTFPVMLYAVAAYGRGREPVQALGVAVVGAMITTLRLWDPGTWTTGVPTGNGWRLFILIAMFASVVAPWALGRFRNVHEAYVGTLEEQARRAHQDRLDEAEHATALERSRIAREMHDVVAHSLSVMVSQAEGGRLAAQRDPDIAAPVLATIATTGREALTEMRGLLGVLGAPDRRTPEAAVMEGQSTNRQATNGLAPNRHAPTAQTPNDRTPQPALSDLDALIDRVRASGTPVHLTEQGDPAHRGGLGRSGELTAYRVVQEALTNVVKHAGPGVQAAIDLSWTSEVLRIEIRNDGSTAVPGRSGHPEHPERPAGRGLRGMRERVDLQGGDLEAGPQDGGGYLVRARIPLADKAIERTAL